MEILPSSSLTLSIALSSLETPSRPTSMPPTHDASTLSPRTATLYFGYGSNLWLHQMRQRCPTSRFLGIARLKGWRWIIYERGYANVVEIDEEDDDQQARKHDYTKEVWGLVYSLEASDEKKLDRNEGVPIAYDKEWIECDFWAADKKKKEEEEAEKVKMLVYVNRKMTKECKPKEEYVYRMNMGIKDALEEGVPRAYVEQVLRRFIPEKEDGDVRRVAERQALEFEDET